MPQGFLHTAKSRGLRHSDDEVAQEKREKQMSPYGLETYPTRIFFELIQISECIFCRSTDSLFFDDFQRPLLKAYEKGNVLCRDCRGADLILLQKKD